MLEIDGPALDEIERFWRWNERHALTWRIYQRQQVAKKMVRDSELETGYRLTDKERRLATRGVIQRLVAGQNEEMD